MVSGRRCFCKQTDVCCGGRRGGAYGFDNCVCVDGVFSGDYDGGRGGLGSNVESARRTQSILSTWYLRFIHLVPPQSLILPDGFIKPLTSGMRSQVGHDFPLVTEPSIGR